eukprot:gene27093-2316_t
MPHTKPAAGQTASSMQRASQVTKEPAKQPASRQASQPAASASQGGASPEPAQASTSSASQTASQARRPASQQPPSPGHQAAQQASRQAQAAQPASTPMPAKPAPVGRTGQPGAHSSQTPASRTEERSQQPASKGTKEPANQRSMFSLAGIDFCAHLYNVLLYLLPGRSKHTMCSSSTAEQVLLLENIATSIKIGPNQLGSVHKLLQEAAHTLQMEAPELYVRQNPVPNAYTLAIAGHKPFIVIHTSLLELLSPKELQAVLAHELGHLKCNHGLWLTVANVLASGTVSVLPVISAMVEEALMRWLRAAELTCDRAALLVAQDPKVVVGALMKLAGGSPSFANELNARSYEEATNSVLGWYLRNAQTRALSHPLPVMRAREIDRWAHSAEYKALLSKNRMNRVQTLEYMNAQQQQQQGRPAMPTDRVSAFNAIKPADGVTPNKGTGGWKMRKL